MPLNLHIQTVTGRCDDPEEPSTAYTFGCEEYSSRELNQFYVRLRHLVRSVENLIDGDIEEFDKEFKK